MPAAALPPVALPALVLPAFEGPLDLLLHLIREHRVDIADIPIVQITDHYLAYLRALEAMNLTVAGEFLLMAATLLLPHTPMLLVLPVLGVVLNGTSSVLYGTVPDLAPKGDTGRAFALFYTGVIGAGGLAPIAYGTIADHSSRTAGILAAALTAASIVPLVLALRPHLDHRPTTP